MDNKDLLPLNNAVLQSEYIIKFIDEGIESKRMMEHGFIAKTRIKPMFRSMIGGSTAYLLNGCIVAIRDTQAEKIYVGKL